MSLDVVIKSCQILGDSAEALAALGAYLQIRRPESDPAIRALLEDVLRAVKPELLQNELKEAEAAAAHSRECPHERLERPHRASPAKDRRASRSECI
jgi:hypothetical protein